MLIFALHFSKPKTRPSSNNNSQRETKLSAIKSNNISTIINSIWTKKRDEEPKRTCSQVIEY